MKKKFFKRKIENKILENIIIVFYSSLIVVCSLGINIILISWFYLKHSFILAGSLTVQLICYVYTIKLIINKNANNKKNR